MHLRPVDQVAADYVQIDTVGDERHREAERIVTILTAGEQSDFEFLPNRREGACLALLEAPLIFTRRGAVHGSVPLLFRVTPRPVLRRRTGAGSTRASASCGWPSCSCD